LFKIYLMDPEFITYQQFNDIALANELAVLLEEHNISYLVEEEALTFDPSFAYNGNTRSFAVKIKSADFELANELLKENANESLGDVEKDYYLFAFTDDELTDVVTKADEWNAFDVQLARKLLAERGKAISDDELEAIEEKRIEELKVPEPPQTSWIIIGYIVAFFGGLFGIFIGWHLFTYKKTLPDGERVFDYNERDRKHGKRIFYISIVVLAICIIYRLIPVFTGD